jgi:hypothetical protein
MIIRLSDYPIVPERRRARESYEFHETSHVEIRLGSRFARRKKLRSMRAVFDRSRRACANAGTLHGDLAGHQKAKRFKA